MRARLSILDLPTTEQLTHALSVMPTIGRYSELVDKLLWHTMKFNDGENFDRESGVHHSAAIAAYAYMLMGREQYRDGIDDRDEAEPEGVRLVWPEDPPAK